MPLPKPIQLGLFVHTRKAGPEARFRNDSNCSIGLEGQPPAPPTCEATLLYLLDVLWPKNTTATRQTMAIRPTRNAYSTRLAPRSLLKRHLHVRYLAMAKRFIPVVQAVG